MRKQERDNILRCLNCFERMEIPLKAKQFTCPKCKMEYYIGWREGQAKILGSVDLDVDKKGVYDAPEK